MKTGKGGQWGQQGEPGPRVACRRCEEGVREGGGVVGGVRGTGRPRSPLNSLSPAWAKLLVFPEHAASCPSEFGPLRVQAESQVKILVAWVPTYVPPCLLPCSLPFRGLPLSIASKYLMVGCRENVNQLQSTLQILVKMQNFSKWVNMTQKSCD